MRTLQGVEWEARRHGQGQGGGFVVRREEAERNRDGGGMPYP